MDNPKLKLKRVYVNEFDKHVKTKELEFDTKEQYVTIYTSSEKHPKIKLYYKDLLRAVESKILYLDSVIK
jgi:transcription termination factor NusB